MLRKLKKLLGGGTQRVFMLIVVRLESFLIEWLRRGLVKKVLFIERWGRAYANFEKLASLDLHIEDIKRSQRYKTEEIKIGKADCEYLLTLTKLLIKFAEELLREYETTKICCS
jgi:hypothetical protein